MAFGGANRYYFLWHGWMGIEETERTETSAQSGRICPINEDGSDLSIRKDTSYKDNQLRESLKEKKKTLSSGEPDEESVSREPSVPTQGMTTMEDLLQGWRDMCVPEGLPAKRIVTDVLKGKMKARLKEHPTEAFWQTVFDHLCASDFLTGRTTGWRASLDWLMKNTENCVKVYEGGYDNVRKA